LEKQLIITLPKLLSAAQVNEAKTMLEAADWIDGKTTAGHLAKASKHNLQLPTDCQVAIDLGDFILARLHDHSLFNGSALANKILPPMFNCYQAKGTFGNHIDNAIRTVPNTHIKIRTDISVTVFLSDPSSYEGGELIIEDTYGEKSIKLTQGDAVLYPSTSTHRVTPVTKGRRLASFFWIQSLIRSDEQRRILFELDQSIQRLTQHNVDSNEIVKLTGIYHNLLRQWSET
jgi:PKHD-type hydroxylase